MTGIPPVGGGTYPKQGTVSNVQHPVSPAYFEGATPENGYRPQAPYTLNILADPRPQDPEPGYLRLFLKTAGADSLRPIKLRQKTSTGDWFLWEYSSILSGIRIPSAEDPWA